MCSRIVPLVSSAARRTVFGAALSMLTASVFAGPVLFSTGDPDGQMATFNASFSLIGEVPEPATLLLIAVGLAVLWWGLKRKP